MSRTANTLKTMGTAAFGDILVYVLKFVTRTVFLQTLGAEYLGIEGLFSNILQLLSLSELGFGTAITYRLYKPIAEGDIGRIRLLMKLYKYIYRGVAAVITILGLICIPLLPILINDYGSLADLGINAELLFVLYLLQSVSTYLFFAYKSALTKAHQMGYKLNISSYLVSILSSFAQLAVLVFLGDFLIYVSVVIVFNIIKNFVFAHISEKLFGEELKNTPDKITKDEFVDLMKDCGSLLIYRINGVAIKATDNLVLSAFVGLSAVGFYANYLMIHNAITSVCKSLAEALTPAIGDLYASGDLKRTGEMFHSLNYLFFALYGLVSVVVFAAADDFVSQWVGGEYVLGTAFCCVFSFDLFFLGLSTLMGRFRAGMGLFQQLKFRPIFGIVINIALSIAFVAVANMGIFGVVLATLLMRITTMFWWDSLVICRTGLHNMRAFWVYLRDNAVFIAILGVSGIAFYCVHAFLPFEGWFLVIVDILVSGCMFCVIAVACTFWMPGFKYAVVTVRGLVGKLAKRISRASRGRS